MKDILLNKKIAVIGLSTEGLSTLEYLQDKNYHLTACDQKNLVDFSSDIIKRLKSLKIKLNLGKNYLDNLSSYDLIFRTPGLPLWNCKLREAQKKGVIVTSATKYFFDQCQSPIIGVTGTKGKGTTTALIGEILKRSGKKVFVGGNIGYPLINKLSQIDNNSLVVLELSSFQLEDLTKCPHISVVLNITSDHLASSSFENPNFHHNQKEYLEAKKNIVKYQKAKDFTIINADYHSSVNFTKYTKGHIWSFSRNKDVQFGAFVKKNQIILRDSSKDYVICERGEIQLRGEHNLENITAGIVASYLAGADISSISFAVKNFPGLEHRLELVREVAGVKYYNDSFATTPETTIAALKSFTQPLILIAGGSDKKSNYLELGKVIAERKVKVIILIGQMADKIEIAIKKNKKFNGHLLKNLKNMKEIVQTAKNLSRKGDVVVLSPACASFGMFQNYKDRGNQFKSAVNNL